MMLKQAFSAMSTAFGFVVLTATAPVFANDSASALTTQGIELRAIDGIELRKEVLTISKIARKKPKTDGHGLPTDTYIFPITVSYEFINTTEFPISTLVAFPLPLRQTTGVPDLSGLLPFIENFTVAVNDQPKAYQTEHKAIAEGKNVTEILQKHQLDYVNFAGFSGYDIENPNYQVFKLPHAAQQELVRANAVNDMLFPNFQIKTTYFWQQTFPAQQVVTIKHGYDASPGFAYSVNTEELANTEEWGCVDDALKYTLTQKLKAEHQALLVWDYVEYILTTANNWDGAIQSFELIIERPTGHYVSLCWPGKIEKIAQNRFRMTAKDFVPMQELRVFWYHITKTH